MEESTNNTYTFTGLTQGTSYNIMVRVTSNTNKTTSATKATTTSTLANPTFTENNDGEIIIDYSSECTNGIICNYKVNNDNAINVHGNTTVYLGADGTIVATVNAWHKYSKH